MSLPLPRRNVTRILTGACAALVLVIALQLAFPGGPAQSGDGGQAAAGSLPPLDELPPYVAPTFESFGEVLERPLFFEDRKLPAMPEVAPEEAPPRQPLQLTLEGIAISGESRVALLRDPRNNELVQVAEGQVHNGWTLESVEGGRAVFRRDADVTELNIEASTESGPRVPVRRRPR